jgi:hypothetical protein
MTVSSCGEPGSTGERSPGFSFYLFKCYMVTDFCLIGEVYGLSGSLGSIKLACCFTGEDLFCVGDFDCSFFAIKLTGDMA